MHICYIDDSGDDQIRVFCALCIPLKSWNDCFSAIQAYRRELRKKEGIYVAVELHATDFVGGRGKISQKAIPKGARCRIYRETLNFITTIPGVQLFNASANKQDEARLYERMMNRINRTMLAWDSQTILVSDEGKDYTSLIRKMRVHNPIPSKYGVWEDGDVSKNITLGQIVEDLFFRRSERSYFIQLADFCAYALLRSERPIPSKSKYQIEQAFELLAPICLPQCFAKDPRKLGIIRV